MTLERWQQIEALYHATLGLVPAERSRFLNEICAGDDALRSEVVSLLASYDQAGSFIDAPPEDIAAGMIAEEQARSMTGRTFGHYKIQSLIGVGGMGKVYRARDTRLDRDVAVKIMTEQLAGDTEWLRRFEREARAVAALSHPNILAIYDYGADDGLSYAVTELLEGETLRTRLTRSPLAWHEAVEVGIAVAEGLSAAHARGIIHRDLKPENVFLTRDGLVKILDFGIARIKHPVSPDAQTVISNSTVTTRKGMVMGTIGYMSPEQVRGEQAEAPSDLFSVGCVMYESLSGRRPFARDTNAETLAAILKEDPSPLQSFASEVPAEFARIISEALRKDPVERYQSARDLVNDLKNLRFESELQAKLMNPHPSGDQAAAGPSASITPRTNPAHTASQTTSAAEGGSVSAIQPGTRTKWAIGAAIFLLAFFLGGVIAYQTRIHNPPSGGKNDSTAIDMSGVEVMRYYLEIKSDEDPPTRATGAEPIEAEREFRFHFTPSKRGYLYIIVPGENNVPTTFLTARPIRETGVRTNLVEAGADYSFPSGAKHGITLGFYGITTNFTVIFSPSPLEKPKFLAARSHRELTSDEQGELTSLWERFGKQVPKLAPQTDSNKRVTIVTVSAERGDDKPIIFDIPLTRR